LHQRINHSELQQPNHTQKRDYQGVEDMKLSISRFLTALAAGILLAGTATAATIPLPTGTNIGLDQSGQDDLFADGISYLNVNIKEGIDGAIDFLVQPLAPLVEFAGQQGLFNAGISAFAFNFGSSGATADNIVLANKSWKVTDRTAFHDFGNFDVIIAGGDRKTNLKFSIVGIEGDTVLDYLTMASTGPASQGNFLFGAEVAADIEQGISNASFAGGAVVPIPATVWLLGSALGLLVVARRKAAD
jgi:hypothetical protein